MTFNQFSETDSENESTSRLKLQSLFAVLGILFLLLSLRQNRKLKGLEAVSILKPIFWAENLYTKPVEFRQKKLKK